MLAWARTHLSCGELVVDSPAANAETPGSCATEEVELGRDIGSSVAGNGVDCCSSMTDLMGGNAGDARRVGIGEPVGGRLLSICSDATIEDAVMVDDNVPRRLETNDGGGESSRVVDMGISRIG